LIKALFSWDLQQQNNKYLQRANCFISQTCHWRNKCNGGTRDF